MPGPFRWLPVIMLALAVLAFQSPVRGSLYINLGAIHEVRMGSGDGLSGDKAPPKLGEGSGVGAEPSPPKLGGTEGGPSPASAAQSFYQQALAVAPAHPIAYRDYGRLAYRLGQAPAAAELLERSVSLNGSDAHAHFYLGWAYLEQGQVERAIAQFRRSGINAGYLLHYAYASLYLQDEPDVAKAERRYQAMIGVDPDRMESYQYTADFYLYWPKDVDKAIATYQAALQRDPAQRGFHLAAADLLWSRQRRGEEAIEHLEAAVALAPDDLAAYLRIAQIYHEMGFDDWAGRWYRQAAEAVPASGEPLFRLGELYLAQGRPTEAVAVLTEAVARQPDVASYQERLAEASRLAEGEETEGTR